MLKLVLTHTRPAWSLAGKRQGEQSRTHYTLASVVSAEARRRIQLLLDQYPLDPELDSSLLQAPAQVDGEPARAS